jgi:succinate dehydrogenase / fumarate reductase flavoprotein subunit
LGGNSLSDLLVFGRRAGLAAAEHAKKVQNTSVNSTQIENAARDLLMPFERQSGENPYTIHRDLQDIMQSLVGIYRTREDLTRALSELEKLKERSSRVSVEGSRMFNPGWHLAQDLTSMLTVSEAVTRSALARQESRGAHSRIDHSGLDATWGTKNNVIVREGATMTLRQSPVPQLPNDLKQLVADEK